MKSELVEPELHRGLVPTMGTPTEPPAPLKSRGNTYATAGGAGR